MSQSNSCFALEITFGVESEICRWIAYYPSIPEKFSMKVGTNLSKEKVQTFEAFGFCLEDKADVVKAMVLVVMF